MRSSALGILVLLAAAAVAPALAAPATSDVMGTVVDKNGQPLADVVLRFQPVGGETPYEGKTNKKGKFWIAGMFNPTPDDRWKIEVVAPGWLPVSMHVESRNVNRQLMGEPYTTKIKAGGPIPEVKIRPLGTATIDLTFASEAEVQAEQQAEAAAAAASAAAAAPKPAEDVWNEALTLAASGDTAGSIPLFQKAVEEKPDDAERHRTLAKVLYQSGEAARAVPEAARAVELEPDRLENRLVLVKCQLEQGDRAAAKQSLAAARQQFPTETRLLHQSAALAAEDGDTAGAIQSYEAITAMDAQDADAWVSLGDLYARSGQLAKSEAAFERVVTLDPSKAPQLFYNIGALALNKPDRTSADLQKAITALKRAIELKPDYLQAHKQLGFALLGTGDRAGAKAELQEYVRLAPSAPDVAQIQALLKSLK